MKKYIIIAGVNGAGKSTLYQSIQGLSNMPRVNNIRKAKSLRYFVEMHYVGVESVEIAKERIKYRVLHGGHGIPDSDVEKRYIETFNQLNLVKGECDLIALYDNTEYFRRFES